jgi:hypothetical protein
MAALHDRLQRGWRLALVGAVVALVLVETVPYRLRVYTDDTQPIYTELRHDAGTLLIVPDGPGNTRYKSVLLRSQMTHQRPIIGGYVARAPDYPLGRGAPLIGPLRARECPVPDIVPHDPATVAGVLNYYTITQIVVHAERLSPERLACVEAQLAQAGLSPTQQHDTITVYAVPPRTPEPFLFLGDGWHEPEQDATRVWRWMKGRGELYLVNPTAQVQTLLLQMRLESLDTTRPLHLALDGHDVGTLLVTAGNARGYEVVLHVPPGEHELRLMAPTGRDPDPTAPRDLSIAVQELSLTWLQE